MAQIYYVADLPLTALMGLAPIFLVEGFLAAGLLTKDAFLVADFFAVEAFLAGALTLSVFLAIFLGALEPTWSNRYAAINMHDLTSKFTFPDPNFCCAFSFLAAALWATVLRSFSSAESLKQPEPFLPAGAPGTRTPPSRIFFSTLWIKD